MELQPRDTIAGWVITERLSAGAMGVAYLAQHPRLPRLDVVKVISPYLASDDDYRARFLREADVVARLEHPHVVTIHDRGDDNGLLYIAMQYVPQGDLRRLLNQDGHLPLATALTIGEQLAGALDAAHELGIVHRDVKPENVLMMRSSLDDPFAVLADFGIAHSQSATALTAAGSVLATPGYAAPEQVDGSELTGACDQYALACLVFEMLTGRVPFPRDTAAASLIAHVTEPPPELSAVAPQYPAALSPVLRRGLAKRPEDRFPTCRSFMAAALAAGQVRTSADPNQTVVTPPAAQVDQPTRGRDRPSSRRVLAAAAALVVAVAVGVPLIVTNSGGSKAGQESVVPATATAIIQPSAKRGGTLQLAYQAPCNLDPATVSSSECASLQELVNRHLLTYAPRPGESELIPDLAEAVPTSADERTWTYHLKNGLRFQDGTPITTADIKYGIERDFAPGLKGGVGSYALTLLVGAAGYTGPYTSKQGLDSIQTPDSRTITFHLQRPFSDWNNVMATALSTPVPAATGPGLTYGQHLVATGPYKFESAPSSTETVLVRNPQWDQKTDPARAALPDRIDIKVSADITATQVSLLNEKTDYAPQSPVTGSVLAQAGNDASLRKRLQSVTGYSTFLLAPVTTVKPLDNLHCRLAVAWAIDRESYQVRSTGRDGGPKTTRILPPPYAEGKVANPFPDAGSDAALKSARTELAKCGHPKGFTTKLGYLAGSSNGAQALAESLAKVGIIVTPAVLLDIGVPAKVTSGGYGLLVTNWGPDWDSPYSFLDPLVDSRAITATGNTNLGLVRNPIVDTDIDAALEASNPAAREANWQDLESYLLTQAYLVPLTVGRAEILRSSRLTNVYVSESLTQYNVASLGVVP